MQAESHAIKSLRGLLSSQGLGVLATHRKEQPYGSLVAFVATDDMKRLIFVTGRNTRKFANLAADGRVAILIDSRSNIETDFHKAVAVTAVGKAVEISGASKTKLKKLYLSKHPHLSDFANAPSCALFGMKVETYFLVERFQHVTELHVKDWD